MEKNDLRKAQVERLVKKSQNCQVVAAVLIVCSLLFMVAGAWNSGYSLMSALLWMPIYFFIELSNKIDEDVKMFENK